MKPFRYLRDPLFIVACALYALNRWLLKPHLHSRFLHGYFNDCLLIACALPPLLQFQSWLGLRPAADVPTAGEIALYVGVWSILFEVVGPHLMRHAIGDPWDVVAYVAGGILAGVWWQRARLWPSLTARTNRAAHYGDDPAEAG